MEVRPCSVATCAPPPPPPAKELCHGSRTALAHQGGKDTGAASLGANGSAAKQCAAGVRQPGDGPDDCSARFGHCVRAVHKPLWHTRAVHAEHTAQCAALPAQIATMTRRHLSPAQRWDLLWRGKDTIRRGLTGDPGANASRRALWAACTANHERLSCIQITHPNQDDVVVPPPMPQTCAILPALKVALSAYAAPHARALQCLSSCCPDHATQRVAALQCTVSLLK